MRRCPGAATSTNFPQAWEIVAEADRANLGLALDSFHILASRTDLDLLQEVDPRKMFLVQLSDFLWQEVRSAEERIETARHSRVFPGEGVHSDKVAAMVRELDEMGYRGDYSFEVFNDDYLQLPAPGRCRPGARPRPSGSPDHVSRRSLPASRPATARDRA